MRAAESPTPGDQKRSELEAINSKRENTTDISTLMDLLLFNVPLFLPLQFLL
uniref:Uncharacterized protein n=1 Tax=Nelumbo nucifera TaxID=4432 RepID=A0A822YB32_NELNU|nr:TPA_asm: hypothetical protein HUJ06_029967 [Nelumbo nucifera]